MFSAPWPTGMPPSSPERTLLSPASLGIAWGEQGGECNCGPNPFIGERCGGNDGNSGSTNTNSKYFDRVSKVRPGPTPNNYGMTGDDGVGPAGEGHGVMGIGIQGTPGGCCDRMCGGGSVSNGSPGPTNGGHDGAADDSPSPATGGRDVARGGGTLCVNAALSVESSEQWGQPAEHMGTCPPVHHGGSTGPTSPVPDSWNTMPRVLSVSGMPWMRQTHRSVGTPPGDNRGGARDGEEGSEGRVGGDVLVGVR